MVHCREDITERTHETAKNADGGIQPQRGEGDENEVDKERRADQGPVIRRNDRTGYERDQHRRQERFNQDVRLPERLRHLSAGLQRRSNRAQDKTFHGHEDRRSHNKPEKRPGIFRVPGNQGANQSQQEADANGEEQNQDSQSLASQERQTKSQRFTVQRTHDSA
jgi:hypothetical protein